MRNVVSILVSAVILLGPAPVFAKSKEATALLQLQDLIREFVGQYRLEVDMEKVYLDFNEKFYQKKKKKRAKNAKTFKEQALKMKITFKSQSDRLVQMPVQSLASRLDQEVIQRFCRHQNLRSKNVRIVLLDAEDSRNPSQATLEDLPTEGLQTISLSEVPIRDDIGFHITAKCVARGKKGRR